MKNQKTKPDRVKEATEKLKELQSAWFQNVAALRNQRHLVRKHEIIQMKIKRRKMKILKTLDDDEYDAIMSNEQLSILLGTNGCKDAEAVFGGCSGKSKYRKGPR